MEKREIRCAMTEIRTDNMCYDGKKTVNMCYDEKKRDRMCYNGKKDK